MTMDCRTGSAQSPTPPQTDLRGTSFTEKRMDAGNSSSLTAGSTHGSVLFRLGEGTKLRFFERVIQMKELKWIFG